MGTPNHLLVAMGIGKAKPSPGMPPSARDKMGPPMTPAPSAAAPPGAPPSQPGAADAGKMSREDAGFIPAGQRCGGCANFEKQSGECTAVGGGPFTASDSCSKAYQPANAGAGGDQGSPAIMIGS